MPIAIINPINTSILTDLNMVLFCVFLAGFMLIIIVIKVNSSPVKSTSKSFVAWYQEKKNQEKKMKVVLLVSLCDL